MTKMMFAAAAMLLAVAAQAMAAGGCPNCYGGGNKHGGKPVFQAAPWYLYWPYNSHFQTPAPLTGAYYAPPSTGATLVSPYFPAQPAPAPQYQR